MSAYHRLDREGATVRPERHQITVWETDALIEALIAVGRPLTADERTIAIAISHRFAEVLTNIQDSWLEQQRMA